MSTATERQVKFLSTLLRERIVPETWDIDSLIERAPGVDRKKVSATIDWLLKQPKIKVEYTDPIASAIPDGYYAVTYNGNLKFYVLRTSGPESKWAGRQWVNRYKSDDELRITRTESDAVRSAIEVEGVEVAAKRFAAETTHCYRCGRRLTDELSRELGIGPTCRST